MGTLNRWFSILPKKEGLPVRELTPVSRVTGGETHPYTNEEWSSSHRRPNESPPIFLITQKQTSCHAIWFMELQTLIRGSGIVDSQFSQMPKSGTLLIWDWNPQSSHHYTNEYLRVHRRPDQAQHHNHTVNDSAQLTMSCLSRIFHSFTLICTDTERKLFQ